MPSKKETKDAMIREEPLLSSFAESFKESYALLTYLKSEINDDSQDNVTGASVNTTVDILRRKRRFRQAVLKYKEKELRIFSCMCQ